MRILMCVTRKGTEDGFVVCEFKAGKEYDVREHLAYSFLAKGDAMAAPSSDELTTRGSL